MTQQATATALCSCPMGAAPAPLMVIPASMCFASNAPAATIMDNVPFMNIMPFGVCMSLANPITAALTAAALGVLTPGPCLPTPTGPWVPGAPTVMIGGKPALTAPCQLICAFGGVITMSAAGMAPTVNSG